MIKLILDSLDPYFSNDDLAGKIVEAEPLLEKLTHDPMAGWITLPDTDSELEKIKQAATKIRSDSKYLVCIGIGGSYLSHKAVIEALGNKGTKILYAGNSLSPLELSKVLAELGDADFSINVISKSGTTTEPAIAFRIFKQKLIEKYGEQEAYKRIYATTDAQKGALHDEAVLNNYEMFVVPDDVGGRYSVLTAVGLLPIAVAGIDLDELLAGAREEKESTLGKLGGDALKYAAARNLLLAKNYNIEILASFEPAMLYFNEWWKQLAGESEGKDGKGIFPASVVYTTDLHSMGQYLQDGRRNLFETVVRITTLSIDAAIPSAPTNDDGLAYLEGKDLSYINEKALDATVAAHREGGVPVLLLEVPDLSAKSLGALIYFFELSIALSGLILGVDPFNQPGVEAYKTNMFRLLGKPGF
jgi:glucose-6-phosphate isomerase